MAVQAVLHHAPIHRTVVVSGANWPEDNAELSQRMDLPVVTEGGPLPVAMAAALEVAAGTIRDLHGVGESAALEGAPREPTNAEAIQSVADLAVADLVAAELRGWAGERTGKRHIDCDELRRLAALLDGRG